MNFFRELGNRIFGSSEVENVNKEALKPFEAEETPVEEPIVAETTKKVVRELPLIWMAINMLVSGNMAR